MSLRVAVAAPFKSKGVERLPEQKFVVALSLDRDWTSPDQATDIVDLAERDGLVRREDGDLVVTFDPDGVSIPEDFALDASVFQERSPFERVLDSLVADGLERRQAVASVNELQSRLGITADAAAVVFARRRGIEVPDVADRVLAALREA
jgi:hypothetical protein